MSFIRFLAALSVVLVLGSVQAQVPTQQPSATLSFGRISFDQPISQTVEIGNPIGGPVTVSDIQLTAPLRAQDIRRVTPPGENIRFVLVLGEDREYGDYEGWVKINFETADVDPIVLAIDGYIVPPIELRPTAAFYVATIRGRPKTSSIEIINHRSHPLVITDASSDSDRFSVQLETLIPGEHYVLTVNLLGTGEVGQQTSAIRLKGAQGHPPMTVMANTILRERVYAFPDVVNLGAVPLTIASDPQNVAALAQTLMVHSPESEAFEVSVISAPPFLDVTSERGPKGDRYQLTLTPRPEDLVAGKLEGSIRLRTNDEAFPELEVPVTGEILK